MLGVAAAVASALESLDITHFESQLPRTGGGADMDIIVEAVAAMQAERMHPPTHHTPPFTRAPGRCFRSNLTKISS